MEETLANLMSHAPYIGVVAVLLISGFGLPIPEDIPLMVAGWMCHPKHGANASLGVMLALCFIAVVGADLMVFTLGRRYGTRVAGFPVLHRLLTPKRMAKAQAYYREHGGKTLFIARFLPGIRTPIYFVAGTVQTPYWKMLACDGSAAAISVPILVLLGYYGAEHFDAVVKMAEVGQIAIIAAIILAVIGVVIYRRKRKNKPDAG